MKCFADLAVNYCSLLNKKDCYGCNFFKTKEQVEKDREMAIKRIDSLDKTTKQNIYEKYFKGE